MNPSIFHEDKIIGVFDRQFRHEDAWKIGNAAGRFLPSLVRGFDRGSANAQCICVGHDMRKHSPGLAEHLIKGIRCAGVNVIDIGMVDTAQIYFAINHLGTCGGIQVTASGSPAHYNGLKIAGQQALPIGLDTGMSDIKHLALSLLHTKGIASGSVQQLELQEAYSKHVLGFLETPVKACKLAVNATHGMAGKMVPLIFSDLGLDILEINFGHDDTFRRAPDPLLPAHLKELTEAVKKERCDLGVCFDGDADRIVVVDEQGQHVASDLVTALLVPYFLKRKPRATVVYDHRSSRVVAEEIIRHEGTPRRERAGHGPMHKAMRDSHAVFGAEMSGHFYYGEPFCADSGLITLIHLLNVLSQTDEPISELVKPLRRYYQTGEVSFQVEDRQTAMRELPKRFSEGKLNSLDGITMDFKDWWFNCRPSQTKSLLCVKVEARSQTLLEEKFAVIKKHMGEPAPTETAL